MYLTQALHRSVQQTPDKVMTVCGDRTRTFREVAERVARLAAAFRSLGVEDGDRIAMLAMNSDRYHEYLLAVPWANAILNPVNIRWSVKEIAYSFADSDTSVLLVDDSFAPMLADLRAAHPQLKTLIYCGDGPAPDGCLDYETLIASSDPLEDARRGGDSVAGIFYTGGTTGFPRGVALSHRNLITQYLGCLAPRSFLRPGGTLLHAAPMFHLADLCGWGCQLTLGEKHVFIPAFEPAAVMQAVQDEEVTDTVLVPTMIQLLVDCPDLADYAAGTLRTVLYGGSPMPQALVERASLALPECSFIQGYGMTELAALATMLGPEEHARPELLRSAGRALPHNDVMIVDEENREVPRGTIGEVAIRGENVMLGYWNNQEATTEVMRDGWMHSGDGAYMDEAGYIFIVDRIKDMIVTGAENVYSAEVENAVASHPGVANCAVIGIPDADWGERVHAVVVLKTGVTLDGEQIREHCKTRIAGYKAPRSVEFVDQLPTTGAGKILKRELRARHWDGKDRQVH